MKSTWIKEFCGAVTVCDTKGIILEMNDKAIATFKDQGGRDLIGTNLYNCHPEPASTKLRMLMETEQSNVYTIEKNGRKKLIHQSPWYDEGVFAGFVELSIELPQAMPHFVRPIKPVE